MKSVFTQSAASLVEEQKTAKKFTVDLKDKIRPIIKTEFLKIPYFKIYLFIFLYFMFSEVKSKTGSQPKAK